MYQARAREPGNAGILLVAQGYSTPHIFHSLPPTPHNTHTHMQGTISGILRGSGRQSLGAAVNFCSYYIVGLPIGIVLALVADLGALGLWSGLGIADVLQVPMYCFLNM